MITLGPGCSDEAEPIAALSRHFNMLVVSYGAEASSLSDRQKYPYFYRTIPQVDHHKYELLLVLLKVNGI